MSKKPNIVIFFVDDMGYGDISYLNPEGKIQTPNLDKFAEEGMIFTDAHSTSSVCSPSRYGLLTGRYNWRSELQRGIVLPFGKLLIKDNILTLPHHLSENGYHCGLIGKWHIGMDWDFEVDKDFHPAGHCAKEPEEEYVATDEHRKKWKEAFSKPIKKGPHTCGFDYSFGVDIPNWPPFCFIENGQTLGIPSTYLPKYQIGNQMASIPGPAMPYWNFHQLLPTFASKTDEYIKERSKSDKPFFLYFSSTSPHTPLAVNKKFIGSSSLNNLYADFVIETDDIFGQVLKSLEKHGVADNTIVIFTSDNGCAPYVGVKDLEEQGHFPSYIYRGYKSDIWDGGHRMPFIIRWPGNIKPNSICDELICLTDIFKTCSDIIGGTLSDSNGVDSFSFLPLLMGEKNPIRDFIVHHSIKGKFAIRDKEWKLVLCPGSGGWAYDDKKAYEQEENFLQLYNMKEDPSERNNLCKKYSEQVQKMLEILSQIIENGRSTPGEKQQNEVKVDMWKLDSLGLSEIDLKELLNSDY